MNMCKLFTVQCTCLTNDKKLVNPVLRVALIIRKIFKPVLPSERADAAIDLRRGGRVWVGPNLPTSCRLRGSLLRV